MLKCFNTQYVKIAPSTHSCVHPLYNVYTAVSLYLFDDNFTLQTLFLWCVYLFKIFSDSCVVITMFVLPWSTWCGRLVLPLKELELSCRHECLQCDRMVQMSIVDCMCVSAMWQDGADVDCGLYVCVCSVTGWCRCRLWIVCVCLQCDRMAQTWIVWMGLMLQSLLQRFNVMLEFPRCPLQTNPLPRKYAALSAVQWSW